jgi:DNA-binding NtrC family response regulator
MSEGGPFEPERPMSRTALIIAPQPSTRRTITQAIRRHGARVLEADGPETVRRLSVDEDVDIVILDLCSLGEDGLLLIPFLRQTRPDIRIILLTGSEQIALSIRGMRLGAYDDISMPLDVEELASKVDAARDAVREPGPENAPRPPTRSRRVE